MQYLSNIQFFLVRRISRKVTVKTLVKVQFKTTCSIIFLSSLHKQNKTKSQMDDIKNKTRIFHLLPMGILISTSRNGCDAVKFIRKTIFFVNHFNLFSWRNYYFYSFYCSFSQPATVIKSTLQIMNCIRNLLGSIR